MLQRSYADVGGVFRVGPPGKLGLFGASLIYEDEMPQQFRRCLPGETRPTP